MQSQASSQIAKQNKADAIAYGTEFQIKRDIQLGYKAKPFEFNPAYSYRAQLTFVLGQRFDEKPELVFEPVTHCTLKVYSKNNDSLVVKAGTKFKIVGEGKFEYALKQVPAPYVAEWNLTSREVTGSLRCEASWVSELFIPYLNIKKIKRALGDELPITFLRLK